MTQPATFGDFERQGWDAETVAAEYDEHFSRLTAQAIEPLLDAAGVRAGMRVLDVATGAGAMAAAAARRGASAVGIDFSASQLRLARQRHPDVEFREGDAAALPFPEGSADAVVMNVGIMHFPDPDAAVREAFRVLRRGGRFAFTAWAPAEEAVALGIVLGAARAHGNLNVALPAGPSFFLFSDPEQCARSLREAGFASPTVTRVPEVWRLPTADALFEAMWQGTVRTAGMLRAQRPEALEAIRATIRAAAGAYERDGAIELPMPVLLAAAAKP